jgi:hypothetical protein
MLIAFTDDGDCRWHEVESGADAFRVVSEIYEKWSIDHKRQTAERHARGDYTLAEMLGRAQEGCGEQEAAGQGTAAKDEGAN